MININNNLRDMKDCLGLKGKVQDCPSKLILFMHIKNDKCGICSNI